MSRKRLNEELTAKDFATNDGAESAGTQERMTARKTSTHASTTMRNDGRLWKNQSRPSVLLAGGSFRTLHGRCRTAGRVAAANYMAVENAGRGHRAFNTLVREWERLPSAPNRTLATPVNTENEAHLTVLDRSTESPTKPPNLRFQLPSSDLLDAIHTYTSEYYSLETATAAAEKVHPRSDMNYAFDRSALLAMGILVEEYMRSLVPGARDNLVTAEDCERARAPTFSEVAGQPPCVEQSTNPDGNRRNFRYRSRRASRYVRAPEPEARPDDEMEDAFGHGYESASQDDDTNEGDDEGNVELPDTDPRNTGSDDGMSVEFM
ncbi:hypothetical protein PhCBS80983_g05513 [Powellomyces hirtus]|uniref:Uncharacterized protein n=1 Tax=Powellomyces hirtus TaxID=109895 RepID=A0A507DWG4_9FUNG|nr:hypothetical protein PhCBS80983_g05513 [Powellomyces hirtus]